MNWSRRLRRGLLTACLLLTMSCLASAGQEPVADSKALEGQLFTTLRDVINRGREYYNDGDPSACFYMFQGALQVTRASLAHRPELQKAIAEGLAEAERQPDMRRRAWVLRGVLDKVRAEIRTETAKVDKGDKLDKGDKTEKPEDKKAPEKVAKPAEPTLWDRLGGVAGVSKVIDEFVALAAEDPKINFSRDGKVKLDEPQVVALKKNLVAFVSQAAGGPIKYTGKSMKEVHKDMGITDEEFDASVDLLVKVMEKNEVKEEDVKAVKTAVEGTRKDIVTKKEEKKDEKKDEKDEKKDEKKE